MGGDGPMTGVRASRVWKVPSSIGDVEVVRGVGGGVAPLLAGFGLATCTFLATAQSPPPAGDAALAALATGTVSLLLSMQLAFYAQRHWVAPSARLDWWPEATRSVAELQRVRAQQALDRDRFDFYYDRVRGTYNAGLCLMLLGLALVLVPADANPVRWAATVFVLLATVVELLWSFATSRTGVLRLLRGLGLVPEDPRSPPRLSELDEVSRDSVLGTGADTGTAAPTGTGRPARGSPRRRAPRPPPVRDRRAP